MAKDTKDTIGNAAAPAEVRKGKQRAVLLNAEESLTDKLVVGVYGQPGTGKTALGMTMPSPVWLLTEPQGWATIQDRAQARGVPVPPTFLISDAHDLRRALTVLATSERPCVDLVRTLLPAEQHEAAIAALPYERPESVVLDSLTELARMVRDEIDAAGTSEIGKDGLPVRSIRAQGMIGERGERIVRWVRDLPFHVLFICLLDDKDVGEGREKSRVVQPSLPTRTLPAMFAAACNAVGVTRVREVEQPPDEKGATRPPLLVNDVRFTGPSYMVTKRYRHLGDTEVPDFGAWLAKVRAARGAT